ncbi:MAG: nucleotidyltransferase family protein [Geminicoccaceae bacterium]
MAEHGGLRPRVPGAATARCSTPPAACGTMRLAMATDVQALGPALAERQRVLRILHEEAPRLRARGITRLSLFGSMARGEAGPYSDIDLLIEIESAAKLGFFELYDLQEELGTLLGRPVQFAFGSAMRPWLREWIEEDRVGIF